MAGGRVYSSNSSNTGGGSSSLPILLQNQRAPPSSFLVSGTRTMVSFEDVHRANRSFFTTFDQEENGDDIDLDEYFHQPEKKRRLTVEQVQFLEKSFELENKLEPERKIQLAKDLGLQPRQVAIWFQNRRARWKTKQLEKDYDTLQTNFNSLKADYNNLLKENDKLKQEVLQLTDKLALKQKGKSDVGILSQEEPPEKPAGVVPDQTASEVLSKSDMFDSDSPHGVHSSVLEAADSSYPFEPDQSDVTQDEEENLSNTLSHPASYIFPKLEDCDYSDPPASSCNFGFHVEDQAFWSSAY
ncbi:hypothetical protein V6N13_010187 [Hibiscus sabdariffa]|uniref:Homeobox-leucine zipper protein n=1 Tax=Hibiscus sabdariffa TaxID=183260 RepID=A0ABR2PR05_9ROSI